MLNIFSLNSNFSSQQVPILCGVIKSNRDVELLLMSATSEPRCRITFRMGGEFAKQVSVKLIVEQDNKARQKLI